MEESVTITVAEQEETNLNVERSTEKTNSNIERSTEKRKWRKKEEQETDTIFKSEDRRDVQYVVTPFDAFKLFLMMN